MKQELPTEAVRFRRVREEQGYTQQDFAKLLDAGNSTADIERGKKKITGKIVAQLLKMFRTNPLWLYGLSHVQLLESTGGTAPKVITLNTDDRENIMMVPVKASAGYAGNLADVELLTSLPVFNIPLPQFQDGSFRAFQVKGDSMWPVLQPDEWVMGRSVESVFMARDHRVHVVVTAESVLVKRLQKTTDPSAIELISYNKLYPIIKLDVDDIKELWEVNSKLSFDLEDRSEDDKLVSLQQGMFKIQQELNSIKKTRPD